MFAYLQAFTKTGKAAAVAMGVLHVAEAIVANGQGIEHITDTKGLVMVGLAVGSTLVDEFLKFHKSEPSPKP